MKSWKKIRWNAVLMAMTAVAALMAMACGDFSEPGNQDVEKTGLIVFSGQTHEYSASVTAVNCTALMGASVLGAGTIQAIDPKVGDFDFIFKVNPNLSEAPPYYVVDKLHISSDLYNLDYDTDCGPWTVEPTPTSEETLTVNYNMFDAVLFYRLVSTLGKPIPNSGSIYITIYYKDPSGNEGKQTTYNNVVITCTSG